MVSLQRKLGWWALLVWVVCVAPIQGQAFVGGQTLRPRLGLHPGPVRAAVMPPELSRGLELGHRLVVKFVDGARARTDSEGLPRGSGAVDLSSVRALASQEGLSFSPLIHLPQATLASLEQRAARRSGKAQPDLAGMHIVAVPGAGISRLEAVGQALADLPSVEFATIQTLGCPPPGDIPPLTPNLAGNQGYSGPNPGIGGTIAPVQTLDGQGIRLSDCEFGWNPAHEDLVDKNTHPEPGQTIDPQVFAMEFDSHGTAVLGETSSVQNGYGCTGLVPAADLYTFPEWTVEEGLRRVTAVTKAIAGSALGDVVLMEMQTMGVNGFVPAELDPALFVVVRAGVDAGVVVVAAAGNGGTNGGEDLDSAAYSSYIGMGDSGAILVGGGSPDLNHDALSFSTFGSRINLQGWGQNVFTLGYGDFAQYGGDKNQRYTSTFNGTSSATAMVAGACVQLQQKTVQLKGVPLDPTALRQLLISTGIAQGSGGHIGPIPALSAAVQALGSINIFPWIYMGAGVAGVSGVPLLTAKGTLLPMTSYSFDVTNARAISPLFLVLGLSSINQPFKGGVLVPAPDLLLGPFLTSFGGLFSLGGTFPAGVAPGFSFYTQCWIADPAASVGFSSTVGVKGTTQ